MLRIVPIPLATYRKSTRSACCALDRDVCVHFGQRRNQEFPAAVDPRRAGRHCDRATSADLRDAAIAHDDRTIGEHALAIHRDDIDLLEHGHGGLTRTARGQRGQRECDYGDEHAGGRHRRPPLTADLLPSALG